MIIKHLRAIEGYTVELSTLTVVTSIELVLSFDVPWTSAEMPQDALGSQVVAVETMNLALAIVVTRQQT